MAGVKAWLNKKLPHQKPTAVVINERNALKEQNPATSIRSIFKTIFGEIDHKGLLAAFKERPPLLIWQSGSPLFGEDSIDELLESVEILRRTILIVNHHCLRDAGERSTNCVLTRARFSTLCIESIRYHTSKL
jgi:hypothetical protein